MKRILGILFVLLLVQPVLPHYKARYHVIVDTDGGIDDFRAICMMLASPEIEIIAITAVDGILSPEETAARLSSLLKHFGHEGIPLGLGKSVAGNSLMPEKACHGCLHSMGKRRIISPLRIPSRRCRTDHEKHRTGRDACRYYRPGSVD